MAQEVFAFFVLVELHLGIDGHDVFDEIEVAERNAGFERVGGDAAVGTEHVVHMKLPHALLGFRLERGGTGGEICIFVAEELIGNFTGEQHADIGLLVNGFADEVHAHAGADGGDVIRAKQRNDGFEIFDNIVLCDDDLGVVAVNVIGNFAGVF